jgi:hypothetical protein
MSIDLKYGRYCDECGKIIIKAHRIFEGKDYCASCYPRVFVATPCVQCGESARVHRLSNEPAVCRKCEKTGRVCIRCERPIVKAGMLSAGKPVCPSCVPHFRDLAPCAACGKPSARLSAMPSVGIHEKVCDSCRNKETHKTCSICRKYRKVNGVTNDGKPFCSACQPGTAVTHQCPVCNVEVPGNGSAKCRSCLNFAQISHETDLVVLTLTRDWSKTLCRQFADWLYQRHPDKPKLIQVARSHQIIFERIDAQFLRLQDVTAHNLLEVFGTSELRKHLLASQFLTETLGLAMTAELKAESADLERIRSKLLESKKSPWGRILERYASWLLDSGIPVRTRRLYLATAEAFCQSVKFSEEGPWSDDSIEHFLRKKPGLRANLFKFVGHCSRAYGWQVKMPPRSVTQRRLSAAPATVLQLQKLLHNVSIQGIDKVDQKTLARIIAKSLGFPMKAILSLAHAECVAQSGKIVLKINGEAITIPQELGEIARAYISRLGVMSGQSAHLQ